MASNTSIMKKKLLVISRNSLSVVFWSTVVVSGNTFILKWNEVQPDIHKVLPDVVVVDGYFSIGDNSDWMRQIVNLTDRCKSHPLILCLSPKFSTGTSPNLRFSTFTERYTFNQRFVDRLNLALQQSDSCDFNLTA